MKINLVENGIFPITVDKEGAKLPIDPETNLNYAGTLQGEGLYIGSPSIFVRTSGCNLRCAFAGGAICDTPYSSFDAETNMIEVEDVVSTVKANIGPMRHVVITGGEPTLQGKPLVELCKRLKEEIPEVIITIETNGTVYVRNLWKYVDLMSISPKLSTSNPTFHRMESHSMEPNPRVEASHAIKRRNIPVLDKYISSGVNVQLKFVVTGVGDIREIQDDFIDVLATPIKNDNIILMPEGIDPEHLALLGKKVAGLAIQHGWRFSPRLHIMIWDNLRSI